MSPEERNEYQKYALQYVESHSAQHWAEKFVKSLVETRTSSTAAIVPRRLPFEDVCHHFAQARCVSMLIYPYRCHRFAFQSPSPIGAIA